METPDCLRCRTLLSAAMDGEATFNETEFVRKHLGGCPDCREAQQAYNSLRAQLRLLPTPEPPAAMRTAVMSRINGRKAVYARRKPVLGLHPLLNPWQKGVFAAAVLVLVFVSGFLLSMLLVQPFEVAAQPVADITDQKVVIVFTRPVDRNYIMTNASSLFSIKDAQNNPLQIDTANIVIDGNRVELPIKRDSGELRENEQIQVVVAPQIKDDKGAAVENPGLKVAVVATQPPNVAVKSPTGQVVAVATTPVPATSTSGVVIPTDTTAVQPATTGAANSPVVQSGGNPTSTSGGNTSPAKTTAAPTTGVTTAPGTTAPQTTAPATTGSPSSPTVPVTPTVATSPTVVVTPTDGVSPSASPSPSTTGANTPAGTTTPGVTSSVPATSPASPTPGTSTPQDTATVAPTTVRPTSTTGPTRTPVISATATAPATTDPSVTPETLSPSTTVSTPAASPSPDAATCKPVELGQGFEKLYPAAQDRIGCPTSAPASSFLTYQVFQKGTMLYNQETGRIYVFYNFGGWASYRAAGPVQVPPTKVPPTVDPSVTPGTATPDPTGCSLRPRGSFGTLWSNNQAVRNSLGCPADADTSTSAGLTQNFARGMMLYNPLASLPYYVIYSDGGFEAFRG